MDDYDDTDDTPGESTEAGIFGERPSSPLACHALSAAELERRLSHYEQRAARRLSLFTRSRSPARLSRKRYGECFGCAKAAPPPNSVARRPGRVDRIEGLGGGGDCSYCPECWVAIEVDRARRA